MNRCPTPLLLATLISLVSALPAAERALTADDTLVYVGTYTGPKSKGIHAFRLTSRGGEPALDPLGVVAETPSPSFLALDARRRLLFAVNEVGQFDGQPTGSVCAYAIDPKSGRLTLINQQPSGGAGPCHLLLDRTGRNLLIANYSAGTVAVLPVAADGRLGAPSSIQRHAGKSIHPKRQTAPHAHAVALDPAERFLFVCDLGLDQVKVYRFDAANHAIAPHDPASAALQPGAGPRHLAFRPDGKFAYIVNELDSTVTTFAYDAAAGRLAKMASISTLPAGYAGESTTAEITVHPSGSYVYASNRGHDSLAIFAVDAASGTLRSLGHQATGGKTPRHFGIDSSGTLVAMGNQQSDTIVLARLDPATGRLAPSPHVASTPSPVCLVFLPLTPR